MPFRRLDTFPNLPALRRDTIYRVRHVGMVKGTQYIVSLLFAALLLCTDGVWGQENHNESVIFYYFVELDGANHEATRDYADNFLATLNNRLAELGISVIFTEIEEQFIHLWDAPPNSLGAIEFWDEIEEGYRPMMIKPSMVVLTDLSPVLFTQSTPLTIFDRTSSPAIVQVESVFAYAAGRCDVALPFLHTIADWGVPGEDPSFFIANCYLYQQDYRQALSYYRQSPDQSGFLGWLEPATNAAWAYLQLGEEDEAFDLMDRLVDYENTLYQRNENNLQIIAALTRRSQLYALAFRFEEAIADMDTAIELDPDNPNLYVERGQRILLLYQWDRALDDYNHAIELDPDYADAYFYRGVLYASVPEGVDARAEAVADFQHYLELAPNGAQAEDAQRYLTQIQSQLDSLQTTPESMP